MGGTDKEMAQINNEYEALFDKLKIHTKIKKVSTTKRNDRNTARMARNHTQVVNTKMENVSIEVIGAFLWVSGNTKPYKEELKALNMKWSNNKSPGI